MSDRLTINISVDGEGELEADLEDVKEGGSPYQDRNRVPFGTRLNAGLFEKLRAISHEEDVDITDLVHHSIQSTIETLEEENGEYTVYEPQKIDD